MSIATASSPDDDDPYLVTSRLEIRSLLRAIELKRALLRMHVRGRSMAIITTILEIDDKNNDLIVDNSAEEEFNRRITSAEEISFETSLDKVRIHFSAPNVTPCLHDNRPALRLPIPDSLTRIQRREAYRVDVPVTKPARCTIPVKDEKGTRNVTFTVQDISAGGIAVIDNSHLLDETAGALYKACRLLLPEIGTVISDMRVVRALDEELPNGKKQRQVGYKFVQLPNPMQIMVQHYIGMLERNLNAKKRGFE
jgi:c-di-GMP-binding flagellar brake protein YcgR